MKKEYDVNNYETFNGSIYRFKTCELRVESFGMSYMPRIEIYSDTTKDIQYLIIDYDRALNADLEYDNLDNDMIIPITLINTKTGEIIGRFYRQINNGSPINDELITGFIEMFLNINYSNDLLDFIDSLFI